MEHNLEALVANWDTAIDKARDDLHKQTIEVWELTDQTDNHKYVLHSLLNDQSNDLEMARRVFNHYIETGTIEYPA
jgi:hypothetical protein